MTKRMLRSITSPASWSGVAVFSAVTCLAVIEPAKAAVDLSGGASVGYEHNSNPIELSESQAVTFERLGFIEQRDDTAKRISANISAVSGANGPLSVRLQSLYSRITYTHLDGLDHTAYNIGGNLDWKPSRLFDLSLEGSQIRTPIGLNDIGGSHTVLQTSRLASATFRVRPTPTWQVSLSPRWSDNKLPLSGADDFESREHGYTVQLGYLGLGAGKLVPGILVGESHGKYSGVENATRYDQQSAGLSLDYKVTNFSSFSLFAGYIRQTTHLIEPNNDPLVQSLEGTDSGFAGKLSYQRQLSVKTSINVSASRGFEQYDIGVNTTVGTGFDGAITWNPTAKLSTTFDAGLVWLKINGVQIARSRGERDDLERRFSLSLKYRATQRVSLSTYSTRRLHNSTVRNGVFDQTIIGAELFATFD